MAKTEQKIKDIVLKHFKDEPVEIFLFGSRAVGNHKYNSDFDIGLMTKDGLKVNSQKYNNALRELDEEVLVRADLVDFATKDDIFRQLALKNKVVWKMI